MLSCDLLSSLRASPVLCPHPSIVEYSPHHGSAEEIFLRYRAHGSRRASWDPKRRAGAGESSSSRRAPAGRKRHVRRGRMRAPMGGAPRPSLTATIDASAARRRTHANACASIVPTGGICRGRPFGRKLGCGSPPPRGASHLPRCAAGRIERLRITRASCCGPPQPAPLGRGWKVREPA